MSPDRATRGMTGRPSAKDSAWRAIGIAAGRRTRHRRRVSVARERHRPRVAQEARRETRPAASGSAGKSAARGDPQAGRARRWPRRAPARKPCPAGSARRRAARRSRSAPAAARASVSAGARPPFDDELFEGESRVGRDRDGQGRDGDGRPKVIGQEVARSAVRVVDEQPWSHAPVGDASPRRAANRSLPWLIADPCQSHDRRAQNPRIPNATRMSRYGIFPAPVQYGD